MWDQRTLQKVREIKFDGRANALAIHPDGTHVATACDDGLVQGREPQEPGAVRDRKTEAAATCVAFSANGKRFAAGGERGWSALWEWPEGTGTILAPS